ncbi:MAG: hypothetical protein J6J74_00245 [Elusimicrobiaceae bacterium]|nr:hypothetical protein [Elusimicrobiaceae bacterium]
MKRLFIFSLLLLSSAAYAKTKNKISMVTYFPVPYVAYSQVNTTDQMDIGLTSTCDMKLGCSEPSATLNATRVNLKGGKLNLDGGLGIKGYALSLGSGNGEGRISFQNVRIQTGNMESVNAADIKATNLNLFGKAFPSCKSANSESGGQMQWASLKLKGASSKELYLMCGNVGESSVCQPTDPRGATFTEPCPAGQTGTVTYTWNEEACTYRTQNNCTSASKKKCIVSKEWKEFAFDAQIQTMYGGACVGMVNFPTYQANIKCGNYSIPQAYTDCKLGNECSESATGYYIYDIWAVPDFDRNLGSNSWKLKKVGIYCVKIDLVSEDECLKGVSLSSPPTGESWYSFDC